MRRIELEDVGQRQQTTPEANVPAEKKCDLKKQTQFVPGEIDAKPFVEGDYDNLPVNGDEENKANLSQLQDGGLASAFEFEEKQSQREQLNMQKT